MKIQFFLGINKELNIKPNFARTPLDYKKRTLIQLKKQLSILELIVKHAAIHASGTQLSVVACGEDFFQGSLIFTKSEYENHTGKCMDRDIVYEFIAKELTNLSRQYPNVLIAPGSLYVSVPANDDRSRYLQNSYKRKASIYTQNIAPILFNGELIRLLKKGAFLFDKTVQKEILSSTEHAKARKRGHYIAVRRYNEDKLEDMNNGLIHLGKTPLPGEETLIAKWRFNTDLSNPLFDIAGIRFAMEICGDHLHKDLDENNLDVHLVSSDGIGFCYDATNGEGYRVQVDAESIRLTCITYGPYEEMKSLHSHLWDRNRHSLLVWQSQPMRLMREEKALIDLRDLIQSYAPPQKSLGKAVFFKANTTPIKKLQQTISTINADEISFEEGIQRLQAICSNMTERHPIKRHVELIYREYMHLQSNTIRPGQ